MARPTGTILALLGALLACSNAAVRVPSFFSDGMVLQTRNEYGARSFMFGTAAANEMVTIQADKTKYTVVADEAGDWDVQLNPEGAGAKIAQITVQGENGPPVVIKNAVFGEVFFCSGQSNMVFPLSLTLNASEEIASADNPKYKNIRLFTVPASASATEQKFLNKNTSWLQSNSTTVPDFSAVCFMHAKELIDMHLGSSPVGLIFSAVGGTRVEAWMSKEALGVCEAKGYVVPKESGSNERSVLWNAMAAPLAKLSIRAALWYQGEANADEKMTDKIGYYSCFLNEMIADWRDRKRIGDFAFMVMQLPPSLPSTSDPTTQTGRMEIRIAQASVAPHSDGPTDISGVAVTLDLGGKSAWGYDHPIDKNDMAHRLALQTMHAAFAQQGRINGGSVWTGPLVESVTAQAAQVIVAFEAFSAEGLSFKNVNNCTTCCAGSQQFEVLVGTTWMSTNATISGTSVVLPVTGTPASVRYAWTDFVQCVVVNSDGLPLGPFVENITTSTKMLTESTAVEKNEALQKDTPIQTPPMGFNSWNFYHCNIDENIVKGITDAMVANGMKDVGYQYVNIDDCWQVNRTANGTIIPDPARFPSGMKAVADYAHSKDMKFGVYTAQHEFTCQGRPGSYMHEKIDGATYCEWGIDYLKIDQCGGPTWPQLNQSWILFTESFNDCYQNTGKYIVRSVESCGSPSCAQWISQDANLWRTGGDVQATWQSVMRNIHRQDDLWMFAKPGHFNDPDMLQVGDVGLSYTEQKSHFSLWCIASAPLLAGTDLIHASNETLAILTAKGPISVNQDLGMNGQIQGHIVNVTQSATKSSLEVWSKTMSTGAVAAILLNLDDDVSYNITAHWSDVGIPAGTEVTVTDLWSGETLGKVTDSFVASVEPHGVVFVSLSTKASG